MRATATVFNRHRILLEWIYAVLLLILLAGFIAYPLYRDRLRIEAQEKDRLTKQAQIIADSLVRQLHVANLSLASVLTEIPEWRKSRRDSDAASRHLKALSDAMSGVLTMFVVDAKGFIVAADRPEIVGRDVSKRDYFRTVQTYPNAQTLYVSVPFLSTRGNFTMNLSRLVGGAEGKFDGMVVAALDPEEFRILLNNAIYAPDMTAFLVHGDGMLFLSVPNKKELVGAEQGKPHSFFTQHLKSGKSLNVFTGNSYALGEDSIIAMATVQPEVLFMDRPIIVAVGRTYSEIFAHWREDVIKNASLFGVVALLTLLGLFAYQRKSSPSGQPSQTRSEIPTD